MVFIDTAIDIAIIAFAIAIISQSYENEIHKPEKLKDDQKKMKEMQPKMNELMKKTDEKSKKELGEIQKEYLDITKEMMQGNMKYYVVTHFLYSS